MIQYVKQKKVILYTWKKSSKSFLKKIVLIN